MIEKTTDYTMSPLLTEIERILRRLAIGKLPMPNNPILGQLAGGRGRSSAARAVDRLISIGRIVIETEEGKHRVVFPDGQVSGWGISRKGHAPFCSNPKGTAPPPYKRKPNSMPMPPQVPKSSPIVVGPSSTCCWPLWGYGEKPNHKYCELPSVKGFSWCLTHKKISFELVAIPLHKVRLEIGSPILIGNPNLMNKIKQRTD